MSPVARRRARALHLPAGIRARPPDGARWPGRCRPRATRSPSPPRSGSAARVERAGFPAYPAGIGPGRVLAATLERPDVDPAERRRFGAQMFAGVAAPAKVPDLARPSWTAGRPTSSSTTSPTSPGRWRRPTPASRASPTASGRCSPSTSTSTAPSWSPRSGSSGASRPARSAGCSAPPTSTSARRSFQSSDIAAVPSPVQPLRPVPFDAVAGEALPDWVDGPARPADGLRHPRHGRQRRTGGHRGGGRRPRATSP